MNDYEIDLKWLVYRVLRAWRPIILVALLLGLAVAAVKFIDGIPVVSDEASIEAQKKNYESEHAVWEAKGENLRAEITNLEDSLILQSEYNETAVLMQINPYREFNGVFELYVDYADQPMPEMFYLDVAMNNRILKSYFAYMTNGEMYEHMMQSLGNEVAYRYLDDLFKVKIDYDSSTVDVIIKHQSEEGCQELLALVQSCLMEKQKELINAIGAHELVVTNSFVYETVNLDLESLQTKNKKLESDLRAKLETKKQEYAAWSNEPQLVLPTVGSVMKSAVKFFVIGVLAGGVIAVVYVAFIALFSAKLLNPEEVKGRFGLRVIGQLPRERVRRPFPFISRWFAAFGGITAKPEDYERLAKIAGVSVKSGLSMEKTIAFTGTVSADELEKTVNALGMDSTYTCVCAADVLTDASAIEKVVAADCVVLVEKQEQSKIADIEKELDALKAWKKTVLGAIIINADAVM